MPRTITELRKMKHRHQTKRAFKVKCRYCGKDLLYWECKICGAKAFFELPMGNRPIRHNCVNQPGLSRPKKPKVSKWAQVKEVKVPSNPYEVNEIKIFSCPVCLKTFSSQTSMDQHFKDMIKNDSAHEIFFTQTLDLINFSDYKNVNDERAENDDKTAFSTITDAVSGIDSIEDVENEELSEQDKQMKELERIGFGSSRLRKKHNKKR